MNVFEQVCKCLSDEDWLELFAVHTCT